MEELLARLEQAGALTPIEVFRRYEGLAAELDVVIRGLLDEGPTVTAFESVQRLRDEFRVYLEHEGTQYYSAFRAKYDFCGLLLSLRASDRFVDYLSRVLEQSHERAAHTPATLSEIRYPVV